MIITDVKVCTKCASEAEVKIINGKPVSICKICKFTLPLDLVIKDGVIYVSEEEFKVLQKFKPYNALIYNKQLKPITGETIDFGNTSNISK
jgi:hypothetical protein